MANLPRLTSVPDGLIHCPITPYTADNKIDLDTFAKIVEFLLKQDAGALCVNLHLAESLNLTQDERKQLAKACVDVAAGRAPVIVNVGSPGTDLAIDLARQAEKDGADCIMSIAPYYWKPPEDGIYEHFAEIITATDLPFIGYNSPGIMDGVGISPATLTRLMEKFPQLIGIKDASHNWETFLELGRAAHKLKPDFGLFVGTEWMIPSLTLGGNACMSVFGGIAPNFVKTLYRLVSEGNLKEALPLQYNYSELYQICKVEYPAPTKAMWEIMGRPVGPPRRPQRPVSAEGIKKIEATLDRMGILNTEPKGW
jgi:dihydrodipicolinate synthase/N-acetylneuraminate lyase